MLLKVCKRTQRCKYFHTSESQRIVHDTHQGTQVVNHVANTAGESQCEYILMHAYLHDPFRVTPTLPANFFEKYSRRLKVKSKILEKFGKMGV